MEFTSGVFILFLAAVMAIYMPLPQRAKPMLLLTASLIFYGFYAIWAPAFVTLFAFAYFLAAGKIQNKEGSKPTVLIITIGSTIALYFLLRYSGLINTFVSALVSPGGIHISIVFPLGFSYYMFKCISYLSDVYNEKIEAETRFTHFLLYTAYFPEISLGPITRAGDFLPQIAPEKPFSEKDISYGFFLILWGFFKKLVFADRLAILISPYYVSVSSLPSGSGWLIVCFAYFIQLYLDFSAYSDISVGVSKMFGYDVKHNFNAPLAAQTMSEYWRRWHMSLSSWFLDYVFLPLQFIWRRLKICASVLAALFTLTLSGLWHGATGGFLLWGFIMGICVATDALLAKKRKKLKNKLPPWLFIGFAVVITLLINTLVLSFTRTQSVLDAFRILGRIFDLSTWNQIMIKSELLAALMAGIVATYLSHVFEWKRKTLSSGILKIPAVLRWSAYFIMLFAIILFSAAGADIVGGFIYAQF